MVTHDAGRISFASALVVDGEGVSGVTGNAAVINGSSRSGVLRPPPEYRMRNIQRPRHSRHFDTIFVRKPERLFQDRAFRGGQGEQNSGILSASFDIVDARSQEPH